MLKKKGFEVALGRKESALVRRQYQKSVSCHGKGEEKGVLGRKNEFPVKRWVGQEGGGPPGKEGTTEQTGKGWELEKGPGGPAEGHSHSLKGKKS